MRLDLPVARLSRGRGIPAVCVAHARKAVAHQPVTFYGPPPVLFLAFMAIPIATAFALHAWGFNKVVGTLGFAITVVPALLVARSWPKFVVKNWPLCDECRQGTRRVTTRHKTGGLILAIALAFSIIARANGGGQGLWVVTAPIAVVGLLMIAFGTRIGGTPGNYGSSLTYIGGGASGYLSRDGQTLRLIRVSPEFVEAVRAQQDRGRR